MFVIKYGTRRTEAQSRNNEQDNNQKHDATTKNGEQTPGALQHKLQS